MSDQLSRTTTGWMITRYPDGVVDASADLSWMMRMGNAGADVREDNTYSEKPTLYPCGHDIIEYFRLQNACPVAWKDVEFANGVARMRIRRNGDGQRTNYKTINCRISTYYRLLSIARGRKTIAILDDVVEYYLINHPELYKQRVVIELSPTEDAALIDRIMQMSGKTNADKLNTLIHTLENPDDKVC